MTNIYVESQQQNNSWSHLPSKQSKQNIWMTNSTIWKKYKFKITKKEYILVNLSLTSINLEHKKRIK